MSTSTQSGNNDPRFSAYYQKAVHAFDQGELERSQELCQKAAELYEQTGKGDISLVYIQLGLIAYWRREFDTAEQWYQKSLKIDARNRNELSAANTYHYLSAVANGRGDYVSAEKWLRESLLIKEKLGDSLGAAESYHQLGLIAYQQDDFDAAEQWYQKSLAIEEASGNEHGAAKTYICMSGVANSRGDFELAEELLWKSIKINEELSDEASLAASYHQLGVIAWTRKDLEDAEKWYLKSLEIEEKLNNELGMAKTFSNLSNVAEDRKDFRSAQQWMQKAMRIFEEQGRISYIMDLGERAQQSGSLEIAKQMFETSLAMAINTGNDAQSAAACVSLGDLSLVSALEEPRNVDLAVSWFRRALEVDNGLNLRARLKIYARILYYRFINVFWK